MTSAFLLFLNIGTSEMMLILVVALFLFGGKKLPELARGLGRGIREFKDASDTIKKDISDQINNFEEEIDSVSSEVKSLAEDTRKTDDIRKSEDKGATSSSSSSSANQDISHSDQYYRSYNYDYPEPVSEQEESAPSQQTVKSDSEQSGS